MNRKLVSGMDNKHNDDELRFNKLYELLGKDVDNIFEDDEVDYDEENDTNEEVGEEVGNGNPNFVDVFNIFNDVNKVDNSNVFNDTVNNNSNIDNSTNNTYPEPIYNVFNNNVEDNTNNKEEVNQELVNVFDDTINNNYQDTVLDNYVNSNENIDNSVNNTYSEPIYNVFNNNVEDNTNKKEEINQELVNVFDNTINNNYQDTVLDNYVNSNENINNNVNNAYSEPIYNIFVDDDNKEESNQNNNLFNNVETNQEVDINQEVNNIDSSVNYLEDLKIDNNSVNEQVNLDNNQVIDNTVVNTDVVSSNQDVNSNIDNNTNYLEEIKIEPIKLDDNNSNEVVNIDNNIKKNNVFRNKTIVEKKAFDDGIDGINYDKKDFWYYFTNKKFFSILLVLVFISVVFLTLKAFYLGDIVNVYNEYTDEVEHDNVESTKVYEDSEIDNEALRKVAADELIACIKSPLDINKLPDSVNSVINEINSYYRSSSNYFAFLYKDIFTGFTVSYNENGKVFAASTIKAPVNIYLYEQASKGNVNLDDKLTYTANYYNNGTGVLKNKTVNTNYTIRELSSYAIRNSDNAAHNMLMDKYGKKNIRDFWQGMGTDTIFTGGDNWGLISAHDAKIYMSELYKFYVDNSEYGNELMNNFIGATTKFITGKNDYIVANKSGWSGSSQHDVSIIFAENPYIIIGLSNMGYNGGYMNHFNKVNDLAYKLHTEYWKYKTSMCNNIKQYE